MYSFQCCIPAGWLEGRGTQGTQPLWADRPGGQAKPWQGWVNIHGPNQAGGKEVIQGVLLEENIGWGAFVTHAHFQ